MAEGAEAGEASLGHSARASYLVAVSIMCGCDREGHRGSCGREREDIRERKEHEMTGGEERSREQEAANGVPQVTDLAERAEGCAAAP